MSVISIFPERSVKIKANINKARPMREIMAEKSKLNGPAELEYEHPDAIKNPATIQSKMMANVLSTLTKFFTAN